MSTDILDLPGWTVLEKQLKDRQYELKAQYHEQPAACSKCGVSGQLYGHGKKVTIYRDSPIRGHATRILARVRRYKCRSCGETFLQPLSGIQVDRRMTERCCEFIKEQCLLDTFVAIAKHVGCDDKTVRNLATEHMAQLNASHMPVLPTALGIDETLIAGKKRCVLSDIDARKPIDMLVDQAPETLESWLKSRKDRRRVRCVVIDMWEPYRDAVKSALPGVSIVIDKFHIVRLANYGAEKVRSRLQRARKLDKSADWSNSRSYLSMRYDNLTLEQKLVVDRWLSVDPTLSAAHGLKEAFYRIYELPKSDATAAFDRLIHTVPVGIKRDFKPLLTAMKRWRTEILTCFDHPITNAYTESLNGAAKAITRSGRGYSFEVLRARWLFGRNSPLMTEPPPEDRAPDHMLLETRNSLVLRQDTRDATNRRVQAMFERRALLASAGGRCASCHGLFEPDTLEVHLTPALVAGEHHKSMALCVPCHRRFHKEGLSGPQVASTR